MKKITNAMVKKAIDDCLSTRWEPAAANENGRIPGNAPDCQLCDLFAGCACEGCPLDVVGDCCSSAGSTYNMWADSPLNSKKRSAIAMRDRLIDVRDFLFKE